MINWINDVFFYEEGKARSNKGKTFTAVTITIIIFMIIISLLQHHYNNKIEKYEAIIAQYNISEHTEIPTTDANEPKHLVTPPENTMMYLSFTNLNNDSKNNIACDKYYWIGDSRTVGLADYYNISYTAKVGCGLDYFIENIDSINELRGYNIIINLGVNDLDNIDSYIYTLNNMSDEFFEYNDVYYLSVNPCEGDYKHLNTSINNFNNTLLTQLKEEYIFLDCNSYLKANGFETVDGLHYTEDTYSNIYNFVMNYINNQDN